MRLRTLLHSLIVLASTSTSTACSSAADDSSTDAGQPDLGIGTCNAPPPRQTRAPFKPELCRQQVEPDAAPVDAASADANTATDAGAPDATPLEVDAGATCFLDCSKACASGNPPGYFGLASCRREGDEVVCEYQGPACGRAPAGLVAPPTADSEDGYLLLAAHLETAAVIAFEHLARDLELHGAPPELVERALRSADDERRHQAVMERLCARRGLSPLPVVAASYAPKSLQAFAEENAVEGCGRETLGALVALHQAEHAQTEELRSLMQVIAEDEVQHAELAWDIAAWLAPRLSDVERKRHDRARRQAVAAFHDMTFPGTPMGLPSTATLRFYAESIAHWTGSAEGMPSTSTQVGIADSAWQCAS